MNAIPFVLWALLGLVITISLIRDALRSRDSFSVKAPPPKGLAHISRQIDK